MTEAAEFYEQESAGMSSRFVKAITDAYRHLCEFPNAGPVFASEVRRHVVRGFPYSVFYIHDGDTVSIIAVAHHSRRPDYWTDRLQGDT